MGLKFDLIEYEETQLYEEYISLLQLNDKNDIECLISL